METQDKIEQRLDEIAAIRAESIEKTEELIDKWTAARTKALEQLNQVKNDPNKLKDIAVARMQLNEADAKLAELRRMLMAYKNSPIIGTPEETDELFTELKRETLLFLIEKTERALELQQELFGIAREVNNVHERSAALAARWEQEASAWIDHNDPKYLVYPPEVLKKCAGWDNRLFWFTGVNAVIDNHAAELKSEIKRLKEAYIAAI